MAFENEINGIMEEVVQVAQQIEMEEDFDMCLVPLNEWLEDNR